MLPMMHNPKVMNSKATSVMVKGWMGGSFAIETTMTMVMWPMMPVPFQVWSIFCLLIDLFIMMREWVLHPAMERMAARRAVGMLPVY